MSGGGRCLNTLRRWREVAAASLPAVVSSVVSIASVAAVAEGLHVGGGGGQDLDCRGGDWVGAGAGAVHDGVEAVVGVGRVRDGTRRAVGFEQGILALHHVTVAFLPLRLHVPGVDVVHSVVERVLGVRLEHTTQAVSASLTFKMTSQPGTKSI